MYESCAVLIEYVMTYAIKYWDKVELLNLVLVSLWTEMYLICKPLFRLNLLAYWTNSHHPHCRSFWNCPPGRYWNWYFPLQSLNFCGKLECVVSNSDNALFMAHPVVKGVNCCEVYLVVCGMEGKMVLMIVVRTVWSRQAQIGAACQTMDRNVTLRPVSLQQTPTTTLLSLLDCLFAL